MFYTHLDYEQSPRPKMSTIDWMGWILMACVVLISIISIPRTQGYSKPTIHEVFFYGWMTAVSTGLGVVPFLIFKEPNKFYLGVGSILICVNNTLI